MVDNNEQMQDVLRELQDDMLHPELVQDNQLHFHIGDDVYRAIMPNQMQIAEANDIKNRKYFQLLQAKNSDGSSAYLMEKNLIKLLKKSQNIDINKMDEEIDALEKKLIDKYISLAKLKDTDVKGIENLKKEKDSIKDKRMQIVMDKAGYLTASIQNQVNDDYYKFLTAMCVECYDEQNAVWNKVWKSFEDYKKDNKNTTYVCLGRLTELMINA